MRGGKGAIVDSIDLKKGYPSCREYVRGIARNDRNFATTRIECSFARGTSCGRHNWIPLVRYRYLRARCACPRRNSLIFRADTLAFRCRYAGIRFTRARYRWNIFIREPLSRLEIHFRALPGAAITTGETVGRLCKLAKSGCNWLTHARTRSASVERSSTYVFASSRVYKTERVCVREPSSRISVAHLAPSVLFD